jgi:hypothetical protein
MHGIKILIGDIVELSPTKLSTLDDLDLEKCTVLEVDEVKNYIKVVFNNNNQDNERFFDNESTVDWFAIHHVIDVERDYKIVKMTDTQDTVTNQPVTIVTMAKVIKQLSHTDKGYLFTGVVNELDMDTFIFVGIPYNDLAEYTGTTKRISLSKFKTDDAVIDGTTVKAYYATPKISVVDDIFILP